MTDPLPLAYIEAMKALRYRDGETIRLATIITVHADDHVTIRLDPTPPPTRHFG